jgi:hypothetical protein
MTHKHQEQHSNQIHEEHPHSHPRRADMLSVEEALARVLSLVEPLGSANISLLEADGLVLAEDIYAPFDAGG